eukprot:g1788.t1
MIPPASVRWRPVGAAWASDAEMRGLRSLCSMGRPDHLWAAPQPEKAPDKMMMRKTRMTRSPSDDFVHLRSTSAGTQWEQIASLLPAKKVQEPRMADFRRFAQLQEMLRVSCTCMREFTRRRFDALAKEAPDLAEACKELQSANRTVAASDFYAQEMQTAAEDAAGDLEREIRQEIDAVRNDKLQELCTSAGDEVNQEGGPSRWVRHQYIEKLLSKLVPKIEKEMQSRLDAAMMRAQEKTLQVALRLLTRAGLDASKAGETSSQSETWQISNSHTDQQVITPGTGHLRGRYPVESVTMLTVTALSIGRLAATEAGIAALGSFGVTATSLQLAGVVGAAIAGIALLGLGTKYALEAHPFWTRETANAEVVAEIQRANHWSILSQAASARGKSQLLYSATRFRYKFSELLLTNGASAEVLSSLFPDLTLLEQVKAKLNSCCQDIEQFMEAEALGERASRDFSTCSFKVVQRDWLSIVDQTSPYVEENARTDAVAGDILASLLALRTEALVKSQMLREAQHTVGIFRRLFPDLTLPLVYDVAVDVLLSFLENKDRQEMVPRVSFCNAELKQQDPKNPEVPLMLQIWYLCVVASFVPTPGEQERKRDVNTMDMLLGAIESFANSQLQGQPNWNAHVAANFSLVKEMSCRTSNHAPFLSIILAGLSSLANIESKMPGEEMSNSLRIAGVIRLLRPAGRMRLH